MEMFHSYLSDYQGIASNKWICHEMWEKMCIRTINICNHLETILTLNRIWVNSLEHLEFSGNELRGWKKT